MAPVLLHCAPYRGSPLTPGGGAGVDAPCPAPVPEPHRGPGHCGWGRPHRPVLRRPVRRPDPHLPPCNPRKAAAMNSCKEIIFSNFMLLLIYFDLIIQYSLFIYFDLILYYCYIHLILKFIIYHCPSVLSSARRPLWNRFSKVSPVVVPVLHEPVPHLLKSLTPNKLPGFHPGDCQEPFRSVNTKSFGWGFWGVRPTCAPPHFSRVNPPLINLPPPGDCMVRVRAWTVGGL